MFYLGLSICVISTGLVWFSFSEAKWSDIQRFASYTFDMPYILKICYFNSNEPFLIESYMRSNIATVDMP